MKRSKSRDGKGIANISSPIPQLPPGEIPPEMSHRTVRSVPRKKSSNSLLKRTTSWTTDRKRDKADKISSPLVRSETVSVASSPTSMIGSPTSPLANSIPVTNVSTMASTTGQRQVDVTRFGEANFNPETCNDYNGLLLVCKYECLG